MAGWIVLLFSMAAILGVIGLLFWSAGGMVAKYRRMRQWPRVPGRTRDARTLPMTREAFRLEVQVDFNYGGKRRRVWCGSPGKVGYTRTYARGELEKFNRKMEALKSGEDVTVIVNPDDPTEAYLRMPELHMMIALVLGGVLFLAVVFGPIVLGQD